MDSSNETVSLDGRSAFQRITDECQLDVDYTFEESDKEEMTLAQRLKNFMPCAQNSIAVCPKCFIQFHNTHRTPLLLPSCGHTVCYPCILSLRKIEMRLACPVCEIEVTANIQSLPINYALLDLIEKESRKCDKHYLEFAGYCKDDGVLLCGACILLHKNCSLSSLSEASLESELDSIKNGLKAKLQELSTWKQSWEEGRNDFNSVIHQIEEEVQAQKAGLILASKEMRKSIETGSEICEQELRNQIYTNLVLSLRETLNNGILETMKEKLRTEIEIESFDSMTLVQKLAVSTNNTKTWKVNLKQVKDILESLKAKIDYEEGITNKTLNLMYNM